MRQTYHPVSVLWHWLIAILIVAAYYFVLARPDTPGPSPEKLAMMSYHKWAGITVLFFSLIRIASRFVFAAPPMGADVKMPAWQDKTHKITLLLMLLLTIAIPLGGWLMSSAAGRPVVLFGLWQLPDLIGVNKDLAGQIKEVHETAAWVLLALVSLHTLAALKHYFVDKDSVLGRMIPFLKK
jgi:cytochrome b561